MSPHLPGTGPRGGQVDAGGGRLAGVGAGSRGPRGGAQPAEPGPRCPEGLTEDMCAAPSLSVTGPPRIGQATVAPPQPRTALGVFPSQVR